RWRVKNIEGSNQELERLVKLRTADLEKRTGEIEALYQADEKILRSVTLNQIFQALVDVSISILKADRSMVLTWNDEKRKITPRISLGFRPETLPVMSFDLDEGLIGIAMKSGHPMVASEDSLSELREDVRKAIEKEGIKSFAHFPIVVDEKVMAIFNVAYTRSNALTKDSIRLFTALVNRASMAIANMELFEQTRDLAVMEARNRLARDLHDSAKQKAFAALAQLGTVNGMAKAVPHGPVPQEAEPHLSEAENLVYEVIQELNFLIQEIYPIALQEKGLPTVLREYVFEWENRNDAMVNLNIQNERELPLETEQAVYRVIQEALANVSRHSRAKRVDVSLVYNPDLLQVTMADDGCGFNVNQKVTGLGFRSMRERISSVRGTFQIQSAPGQGTRIIIQIPLKSNVGG
ncbi:MAG: ATP-binding protein, partial [Anaerolineae bacterium]